VRSVDMITPYLDPSPHGHGVGRPADEAIDIAQLQARVHHTCRTHNDGDALTSPGSGVAMAVLRHAALTWGDPVWAVGGKACQHSLGRRNKGLGQQARTFKPQCCDQIKPSAALTSTVNPSMKYSPVVYGPFRPLCAVHLFLFLVCFCDNSSRCWPLATHLDLFGFSLHGPGTRPREGQQAAATHIQHRPTLKLDI
jgi:hypothetical protein